MYSNLDMFKEVENASTEKELTHFNYNGKMLNV